MTLYVGGIYPEKSLEESAFNKSLLIVSQQLLYMRNSESNEKRPSLELSFLLPGKKESPGFTGMRLNSYDKTHDILYIESVVPDKIVDTMLSLDFIIAAMRDAVDNANFFFLSMGRALDIYSFQSLIDSVERSARVQTSHLIAV